MSFKSKKQREKFLRMEHEGKLPKGTVAKWDESTPNLDKLPEKVKPAQKAVHVKKVRVIR